MFKRRNWLRALDQQRQRQINSFMFIDKFNINIFNDWRVWCSNSTNQRCLQKIQRTINFTAKLLKLVLKISYSHVLEVWFETVMLSIGTCELIPFHNLLSILYTNASTQQQYSTPLKCNKLIQYTWKAICDCFRLHTKVLNHLKPLQIASFTKGVVGTNNFMLKSCS